MANSDIKLKHKVQLRRKVEEPELAVEETIVNPDPQHNPEKPKSKTWIWWLIGIIVLCFVGNFIFSISDNNAQMSTEVEDISATSDIKESVKTVTEETEGAEPKLADDSHNDVKESVDTVEPAKPTETIVSPAKTPVEAVNVSNDVEAEAMKVIRGDYGIGQERKNKLGEKYQTIQNRVNELKREGVF